MLLKSIVFAKNVLTGPGSCSAPGVGLALHDLHLQLLLLLLAASDSLLLLALLWLFNLSLTF